MSYEHPVPKNLLTHIGDITVSFAMLEFHMQMLFVCLLDQSPRIGHMLTSQLTFSRLRASIISLYKERFGEDDHFAKSKEMMVIAGKIEEERNLITHSIWGSGEKTGSITRIKITAREKRGYHAEYKQYDEQIFTEFADSIKKLTSYIFIFNSDHVPTSQKSVKS